VAGCHGSEEAPLNPGLSVEGADEWFEEMQVRHGWEQLHLGTFLQRVN
jgi:hypothetical protein